MKAKGDNCYSITKEELRVVLQAGAVLWTGKFGPSLRVDGKELHPRRDTVRRMLAAQEIEESGDANEVQRDCGMRTFRVTGHR